MREHRGMNQSQRSVLAASGYTFRTNNISKRVQNIGMSPIKEMMLLANQLYRETGEESISFGQGVPSFDTPEHIKEGIRVALKESSTARYTLLPGIAELRECIAQDLMERKGIASVDFRREIVVSTGCQEALVCALATVIDEGDEVLLPAPTFPSYGEQIRCLGGVPVFVPLDEQEHRGWRLNIRALRERLSLHTRAILFSHPSNPTGTVFTQEELSALGDIAKERDLILISDETYDFLCYEGISHCSPASFLDIRDRVILCGSFSKRYALTGYRVGYLFAEEGIINHILKVHDALAICAPTISQKAALAALRGDHKCVAEFVSKLEKHRHLMGEKLDELSDIFSYHKPEGAYYIFAKYRFPMPSVELAIKILREAKVVTIPGIAFGPPGEHHLRFSFACSADEIEEGFGRLKEWARNASNSSGLGL